MQFDESMYTVKARVNKAWEKENANCEQDWVVGFLVIAKDHHNNIQYRIQPVKKPYTYCSPNNSIPIDPNTVCRPTGQKDRNGDVIYEHDQCFVEGDGVDYEDGLFEVLWDEETSRFVLSRQGLILDFDNTYGHECAVIGNTYDNPGFKKEEREAE